VPVLVTQLGAVRSVTAGGFATCAITTDRQLRCWGSNEYGQLGVGPSGQGAVSELPVTVAGLSDVTQVSLGGSHSCAVTGAGALFCWGANAVGQLGDGTRSPRAMPTRVASLTSVGRVEASAGFTLAIDKTVGLVSFGNNSDGQLGDGTRTARALPGAVRLP
jgi:alpha-tubulin suppressor-like RCC1 family protein